MAEETGTPEVATPSEEPAEGATPSTETPATDKPETDSETLGEAGKKALSEERTARKAAEAKAKEMESELSRLRRTNASVKGTDLDAIKAEIRAEYTGHILRAEVKAAATGRLSDPSDALRFLDLDGMSATGTGEVDSAAVKAAVDKLLTDKPYLAADAGKKWGDVGSGPRETPSAEPASPEDRMRRAYGNK